MGTDRIRNPTRPPWPWFATPEATSAGRSPAHGGDATDRLLLAGLVAVAAMAALVLATGHLSALAAARGWPRYRLADAPGILARVVTAPGDPGRAWDPVNVGAAPPGPLAWWATLAAVVVGPAGAAALLARRRRRCRGTAWAGARQLRRLRVRGDDHGRLVLGTQGRRTLAVESRHSLLVLGPTQTGKTTGLAVPAILEWPGPVVATSVKGDLLADTLGWRSRQGTVWVYDPAGATAYPRSGWTPLAGCGDWAGAMRGAWELTRAAKAASGGSMALADFWFGAGAKALAPLLRAAAMTGRGMDEVARWVDREDYDGPYNILRRREPDAALAHEATFRRDPRSRSSLVQVMQTAVGPYLDPVVAGSAHSADIDAAELLAGGSGTLYLTAPPGDQERLRPLFTALVGQVVTALYRRVAATGEPLDPPLLVVLDEAANIAPVEDLPVLAATAAAMGLQMVTVFQDLAQVRLRYGAAAGTVVNNHRAKLLLPAVSDPDTLDLASKLVGEEETERDSTTTDAAGRRSSTTAAHWRRLLPPDGARCLGDGEAVLLYGNLAPARLRLRPWYRVRRLRQRAAVPPPAVEDDAVPADPPPLTVRAHRAGASPQASTGSVLELARARRGRTEVSGG